MDLASICASLLLLVVPLLSSYQYLTNKRRTNNSLPPGKTGWPLIGETLDFLYCLWRGHPEDFFNSRTNKHSPEAFTTHLFGEPMVVLCGPNGHKFLFSNENKLVKAWWPVSFAKIFDPDHPTDIGDESKKIRKTPHILRPDFLKIQLSAMDEVAQRHFSNEWEGQERVVTHDLATEYTLGVSCRVFLSVDDPEQVRRLAEPFARMAVGISSIPIDFPGTTFHRALKAVETARREICAIVRRRRLEGGVGSAGQDMWSQMMAVCGDEDGQIFKKDSEITHKIGGLILAGRDTISSTLTSIVKFLAELPQVYDKVYQEQMEIAHSSGGSLKWDDIQKMKYSWNVACEAMRLAPPAFGTFREAIVDFEYQGFFIPKGHKLHWSVYTTHLDPKYFSEPLKFDPMRFEGSGPEPFTFLPFGGGPRICVGKEYARVAILVFMHHLVRRFKWDKVIPDEKISVNPMPVPVKGLPIRLYPH